MAGKKLLLAGIDAGGTTFKLGVAAVGGALLDRAVVETTSPDETIEASVNVLRNMAAKHDAELIALGVASFGPVDVDSGSVNYGTILDTPKKGCSGAKLKAKLESALSTPVTLDTDVNAALIAERTYGAAQGSQRAAYITVGTGVGVGVLIGEDFAGRPFHPELGHIRVERHPDDVAFPGVCAIHGGCLEGLLSAPALIERFGILEERVEDDPCWDIAGSYLAQLCLTLSLGFRLERIVVGGGVLNAPSLLGRTRREFVKLLGPYLREEEREAESLIVRAALGDNAGLLGAIELARK